MFGQKMLNSSDYSRHGKNMSKSQKNPLKSHFQFEVTPEEANVYSENGYDKLEDDFPGFIKEEVCQNKEQFKGGENESMDFSLETFKTELTEVDSEDLSRARLSCPKDLEIRSSTLGSGYGVWCVRHLPRGVWFGPYEGKKLQENNSNPGAGYCWPVFEDNEKRSHLIDAKDTGYSNWMRYVNAARYVTEQNLLACQYEGEVYYKTLKLIQPNTELLVWYGEDFMSQKRIPYGIRSRVVLITNKKTGRSVKTALQATNCCVCKKEFSSQERKQFEKWSQQGIGMTSFFICQVCSEKIKNKTRTLGTIVFDTSQATKKTQDLTTNQTAQIDDKDITVDTAKVTTHLKMEVDANITSESDRNMCKSKETNGSKDFEKEEKFVIDICPNPETNDVSEEESCYDNLQEQQINQEVHIEQDTAYSYYCDVCKKGFNMAVNLSVHMLTHRMARVERPGQVIEIVPTDIAPSAEVLNMSKNLTLPVLKTALHSTGDESAVADVTADDTQSVGVSEVVFEMPAGTSSDDAVNPISQKTENSNQSINDGDDDVDGLASDSSETEPVQDEPKPKRRYNTKKPKYPVDKPYVCELCGKTFVMKSFLTFHMNKHLAAPSHFCTICGKGFNKKTLLAEHMDSHAANKTEAFTCGVCGDDFETKRQLQTHMEVHSDSPLICNVCGKEFKKPHNLQAHTLIHSGQKPYKCVVCGKAFSQQANLSTHLAVHSENRPHRCEVCGKGFKLVHDVRRHMSIHSGEKPFSCSVCGKSFKRTDQLVRHFSGHWCNICNAQFIKRKALFAHMKTHVQS